uniref:RFX-type winged-helix domain-containing protein n=1 Tax=Knipowitschia caucasica TaxID=637954 RepID=A0AAV2L5W6_KNICA
MTANILTALALPPPDSGDSTPPCSPSLLPHPQTAPPLCSLPPDLEVTAAEDAEEAEGAEPGGRSGAECPWCGSSRWMRMHCDLEEPDMESTESWIERCLNESESKRYSVMSLGNMSNDEHEEKENNRASKPHSTPATLEWLEDNYEIAEGVCIPRSALYMHYLDFSEKHDMQPVNAASFGKS